MVLHFTNMDYQGTTSITYCVEENQEKLELQRFENGTSTDGIYANMFFSMEPNFTEVPHMQFIERFGNYIRTFSIEG
jgi:hypothetical protein